MALLPLLCALAACALEGRSLLEVYLPASEWNDELFYYKQVEGILAHGYPYGYFGFNESHALQLSFAAWSPVLVLPWVLFGLVFGWGLQSPVFCNILLMTLAMFLFVLLVKPSWKQLGLLALLYSVFTPFTRYMLSGMPEVICFSLMILYLALMTRYLEGKGRGVLAALFVLAAGMTLMRPYLILMLLFPMGALIRQKKWAGAALSALIFGLTAGAYGGIKHYLGAAYFTPLFQTGWLEPFAQGHILAGLKGILVKLFYEGRTFLALTLEGLRSGIAEGAVFAAFLLLLALLVWQSVQDFRRGRKSALIRNGYLAFCYLSMLAAILLMYKMKEGSKHLLTFMAAGIFAVSLMETRFYKKTVILGLVCVYLFSVKAVSAYDYQIPFRNPERVRQVEAWRETFAREMTLETEGVPSFENVVIWVFAETDPAGGGTRLTDWQILYALPEGFGISCCEETYVREHFESLQSRYLTVPAGGELQRMCKEAGWELLGEDGSVCVYRIK